jgi:hypothetical protein
MRILLSGIVVLLALGGRFAIAADISDYPTQARAE